jgi:hypothetical protein
MEKCIQSDYSFISAVFRRRDDFSLIIGTFTLNETDFSDYVNLLPQLSQMILPPEVLPFFITAILPYADSLPDELLHSVIARPEFAADDPLFPAGDFVSSQGCLRHITFHIFVHIFPCDPDESLVTSLFSNLVIGCDPLCVFRVLIRAPAEAKREMARLFVFYLQNYPVNRQPLLTFFHLHMRSDSETLSAFALAALEAGVGTEYFLASDCLSIFQDCAFTRPLPGLGFLLEVTKMFPHEQVILDFWGNPLVLSSITDAVLIRHQSAKEFTQFLLAVSREAPEWLVRKTCKYVRHLQCFVMFEQNCRNRFDPDSPVFNALAKYRC